MDSKLIDFFVNNWLSIIFVLIVILPLIPARIADPFGYEMSQRMTPPFPNKKWSMLKLATRSLFEVFSEFALNLGLKGSISVILFTVVGTDLYFNKAISMNTVIVIIVAVVALYLEYMITNAEEIEFFKVFKYKSKKQNLNPLSGDN